MTTGYKTQLALIIGLMETRIRLNAYDDSKQVKNDDQNIVKILRELHKAIKDDHDTRVTNGAKGGKSTSDAKREAARANGKKRGSNQQTS